jgi:hypothetical protein
VRAGERERVVHERDELVAAQVVALDASNFRLAW